MTEDIPSLRDLLTRVASGELDPAEAARLLDEDPSAPTVDRTSAATPAHGITGVLVHAGGVKLRVIADPSVDTAVAVGPHAVRQDGHTLVIDAPDGEGYRTTDAPRFLGWVPAVWTGGRGERVTVRVNPGLALTVDATACSVEVVGMAADLALAVISSSVKVREHRGAVRGSATMCSVDVVGVLTGPGSFVCELGSLNLRLLAGSDMRVSVNGEMSSFKVNGAKHDHGTDSYAPHPLLVGAGSVPYDVTVRMGSASVVSS